MSAAEAAGSREPANRAPASPMGANLECAWFVQPPGAAREVVRQPVRKLERAPMLKLLAVGLLAISCAWAAPDPALTAGQVTADFGGGGRRRRRRPLPPVLLVWQRNRMLGLTASLPCPCISPGRNADGRVGAGERRSPVWCEAQLGRGPAVLSCACPAHLTHAMPYSLPLT